MFRISRRRALLAGGTFGALALGAPLAPALGSRILARALAAQSRLSGTVYTADEEGNSISAIDLATSGVTTVEVPVMPHNVQIADKGRRLLAVGSMMAMQGGSEDDMDQGVLIQLDPSDLARGVIGQIAVGRHPAHVVADADGRFAFVTVSEDNAVNVVDLEQGAVAAVIPTGAFPHGLRMSPDGREICVANVKDGSVSVIDIASRKEADRIEVGNAPVQVAFQPNGERCSSPCAMTMRSRRWTCRAVPHARNSRSAAARSSSSPRPTGDGSTSPTREARRSRTIASRSSMWPRSVWRKPSRSAGARMASSSATMAPPPSSAISSTERSPSSTRRPRR